MSAPTTGPDLQSMLHRLSQDDEQAFTVLYNHYEPRLRSYLNPFTHPSTSDTDEIIQEIFIRIWTKREGLTAIRSFDAYLFRMARNLLIDNFRERSRYIHTLSTGEESDAGNTPVADELQLREYGELARKAIGELSPQRRAIFTMRQEQDLSLDQIAERLQITKFAVKKQLYEASAQVRDYLRTHGALPALILAWLTDHWTR